MGHNFDIMFSGNIVVTEDLLSDCRAVVEEIMKECKNKVRRVAGPGSVKEFPYENVFAERSSSCV